MAVDKDSAFGRLAVERGHVTPEQLAEALEDQELLRGRGMQQGLAQILFTKGWLDKDELKELRRETSILTGEARLVGDFETLAEIGRGGMGVVYKARRKGTDELVALKVLRKEIATEELVARFKREVDIVARLKHPNIVGCRDWGFDEKHGCHYCALELVEGEDLGKIIKRRGVLPEAKAVAIVRQIAEALRHAHEHKLIHRDIKPENIMVTPEGTAKLLDLGLARPTDLDATRYTQTGAFVGSLYYASPEHATGKRDIDIRSDIYSLGCTLYHMVTGRAPFEGDNAMAILQKHAGEKPAPPAELNGQLSPELCIVIETMMEKDREKRQQTPGELLEKLSTLPYCVDAPTAETMSLYGVKANQDGLHKQEEELRPTPKLGTPAVSAGPLLSRWRKLPLWARVALPVISGCVALMPLVSFFWKLYRANPKAFSAAATKGVGTALGLTAVYAFRAYQKTGKAKCGPKTLAMRRQDRGDADTASQEDVLTRDVGYDPSVRTRTMAERISDIPRWGKLALGIGAAVLLVVGMPMLMTLLLKPHPYKPSRTTTPAAKPPTTRRAKSPTTTHAESAGSNARGGDRPAPTSGKTSSTPTAGSATAGDAAHAELDRYLDRGDYENAAKYLTKHLSEMPTDVYAWLWLGDCYGSLNKWSEAIDAYNGALQVKPDCVEAWLRGGNILLRSETYDEAVKAFQKAVRLKPSLAEAQACLGLAYCYSGKHAEAVASYRRALSLDQKNATYHYNLGMAYVELERHEDAALAFECSLSHEPEQADAHCNLGIAQIRLGRMNSAYESIKRALELDPDLAIAHFVLGRWYLMQGNRRLANRELVILERYESELAGELRQAIDLAANGDGEGHLPLSLPTRRPELGQGRRSQAEPRFAPGAGGFAENEAYESVLRKVEAFEATGVYDTGWKALVSDPDYRRYRDVPRFKALRERLKAKADALEKETGRRDAF